MNNDNRLPPSTPWLNVAAGGFLGTKIIPRLTQKNSPKAPCNIETGGGDGEPPTSDSNNEDKDRDKDNHTDNHNDKDNDDDSSSHENSSRFVVAGSQSTYRAHTEHVTEHTETN